MAEDWLDVCTTSAHTILLTYFSIDLYNQSLFFPQKFSPWEIPRHDVVFPVRFFGHVEILPDGS